MKVKNLRMGVVSRSPLVLRMQELWKRSKQNGIELGGILEIFGRDGHHLLILFLIIPFLQPIPLFGLSSLFGTLICILVLLYGFGKPAWLPKRWEKIRIKREIIYAIAVKRRRWILKISKVLHPRLHLFFRGPFSWLSNLVAFISAVLLALPLPIPFSNAFPAWVIFLQAIAHLEDDGLFVVLSYVQFLLCTLFFILLSTGLKTGWIWLDTLN